VIPLYGGDVMGTLREAIYGYATRLDAEADRVQAIPKTRQHGTTYNANVAVGIIAAARFLREWALQDDARPEPEVRAVPQALRDKADWARRRAPDASGIMVDVADLDAVLAQVSALQANVARLEGERDEAQRAAEQWLEVAHSHEMKLAARTVVVEAAEAWRQAGTGAWTDTTEDEIDAAEAALTAAVDQMGVRTARSEPQSDEKGSGVAQDVRDVAEAETGGTDHA
jgi:hypothetical protein